MRTLRNIIHLALVLTLLAAGMPLYHPGDANRDDRVDLADAILRVQGVANTADQPGSFRDRMEDVLITLSAMAGFGKVLKADRSFAGGPILSGEPGLLSGSELSPPHAAGRVEGDEVLSHASLSVAPDSPPPRSS